jgi:hypothetical protein
MPGRTPVRLDQLKAAADGAERMTGMTTPNVASTISPRSVSVTSRSGRT